MFRWVDHTAELELEIEAQSEEGIFSEAVEALTELIGEGEGEHHMRDVEVRADEPAMLLVEWLGELVYLSETEGFVARRVASLDVDDGRVRATVEGRAGEPRHLVKAVTLHRLELRPDVDGRWHARVVLDV